MRKFAKAGDTITVSYESSSNERGIRGFKLVERYALDTTTPGVLRWAIELTNTGTAPLEIGDLGLPLPFNEYWAARDVIYETRTVYHSLTGQNSSYITVGRPSREHGNALGDNRQAECADARHRHDREPCAADRHELRIGNAGHTSRRR